MNILVAFLALAISTLAQAEDEPHCVGVDGPANVRESGDKKAKILESIPKGSTVIATSKIGEWYKVVYFSMSAVTTCSTQDPAADSDKAKTGWLHEKNILQLNAIELFRLDSCGTNTGNWEGVSRGMTATLKTKCKCTHTHYGDGGSYCSEIEKAKGSILGSDCARLSDFVFCDTWDGSWGDSYICPASCIDTKKSKVKKTNKSQASVLE